MLNQAVSRNSGCLRDDFMFQVTLGFFAPIGLAALLARRCEAVRDSPGGKF